MTGHYVLGDWGTTRLRLYRLREGVVFGRAEGPGIGNLDASPIRTLMGGLEDWRGEGGIEDVVLCGMAGARGGLVEADYLECPAAVGSWRAGQTRMLVEGLRVAVTPGLRCRDADGAPDIMRGEETQIFGALALMPALSRGDRQLLLPGTHSKWAWVRDGTVTGFRTCPTGELFALLTGRSTLTGPDSPGNGGFDEGFLRGLERRAKPLGPALFEARAARMVDGWSRDWAKGFLSGLLIGHEIHAEAKVGEDVVVIGDPVLCDLYGRALSGCGIAYTVMDGDAAVLAGLQIARGKSA